MYIIVQATLWGDAARLSYDPANTPDYVETILGPMRQYYVSQQRSDKELLSANVQVTRDNILCEPYLTLMYSGQGRRI